MPEQIIDALAFAVRITAVFGGIWILFRAVCGFIKAIDG